MPAQARVSILRQSRRLYGRWPLKGAFSQPLKAKARTTAREQSQGILPELSNFYCLPGRAGGSPDWTSAAKFGLDPYSRSRIDMPEEPDDADARRKNPDEPFDFDLSQLSDDPELDYLK